MLTDEERQALVFNKVRRSKETWTEAKGIIENKYWYAAANRMCIMLVIIWFLLCF